MTRAQQRAYRARHAQAIERETQSSPLPDQSYVPFYRGEATVPDQKTPPAIDPIALNALGQRAFHDAHRMPDALVGAQQVSELPQVGPGCKVTPSGDTSRPNMNQAVGMLPTVPGGGAKVIEDSRHDRGLDHVQPTPSMIVQGGDHGRDRVQTPEGGDA